MDPTASGAAWEDDEEWELQNDDGFVFKSRKKRRRVEEPSLPAQPSAADLQKDAEKLRRERKKKKLLQLKAQYQAEIDHWDILSSTLRAVEERTRQLQQQQLQQQQRLEEQEREQTASLGGLGDSDSVCGSLLDELLLQVEAHEAIIRDVSNVCDIAEAMCDEQEKQIAQSLIDLPFWGSPRKLMSALQTDP